MQQTDPLRCLLKARCRPSMSSGIPIHSFATVSSDTYGFLTRTQPLGPAVNTVRPRDSPEGRLSRDRRATKTGVRVGEAGHGATRFHRS